MTMEASNGAMNNVPIEASQSVEPDRSAPADAEAGTNGFTAVNGRGSPTSPPAQIPRPAAVENGAGGQSLPIIEAPHTNGAAERPHQSLGLENHSTRTSPTNGSNKRRRSEEADNSGEDVSSDESDEGEDGGDVEMEDASGFQRNATDNSDGTWQHNEDAHMLAPIQRENQQYTNGGYSAVQPPHHGDGMRPVYQRHVDEVTGLITTNAGVIVDPKKRKRVSSIGYLIVLALILNNRRLSQIAPKLVAKLAVGGRRSATRLSPSVRANH